jgi:hypothetical protein
MFRARGPSSGRRLHVPVWYNLFTCRNCNNRPITVISASKHMLYLICIIGTVFKELYSRRNFRVLSRCKREIYALLGFYAAYNGSPQRRYGKTYCPNLQGLSSLFFLTLQDGTHRLSRKNRTELTLYAAKNPKKHKSNLYFSFK